ncbi:PIN domain-containing protein [Pisolithus marmoratus]|nr:PIN domain-containing protein [Pisolithus marmoratus]
MLPGSAQAVLHGASNNVNAVQEVPVLDATLKRIDDIANTDVEMQGPLSEQSTIIVVDTNVLLEFLDVLQTFVSEIERHGLPVLLIIPGVVIYELDSQKNRDGLSWFARRASTWLLSKVKERRTVKGQALEETCKASRNWKKKEPGEELGMDRTNDSLILDCCQYFFRRGRTFLCSKDKILAVEAESAGIPTIFPHRGSFCSRDIAYAVFGQATAKMFSGYYPVYSNESMERDVPTATPDEDGMDVDDDSAVAQVVRPSHALDLLHLQVIEYFSLLLLDMVGVVGHGEVQKFGGGDVGSRHAPSYARKHIMFWTASDCVEYLDSKKRCPRSSPRVEVFLTKPYEGRGARRGQDWSRRDWEVALGTLAAIGEQWEAGSAIRDSMPAVLFHVSRIFSMPMRPTGL